MMRWKPALNAFEFTFSGRSQQHRPAEQTAGSTLNEMVPPRRGGRGRDAALRLALLASVA